MTDAEARAALVRLSREAISRGLSNATAGNISVRAGQGMLITPSSIPPERMTPRGPAQPEEPVLLTF